MMLLGFAYDFSHEGKYLNAMVAGMDYLLGRNAMAQSFVTGYGTSPFSTRITGSGRTRSMTSCPRRRRGACPAARTRVFKIRTCAPWDS